MHITLITGSFPEMAAKLESELIQIDGVEVEFLNACMCSDNRGMKPISPIRMIVDDKSVYVGYDNIRQWMERHHHLRVARRHSRMIRQANQPLVPALA